VEIIFPATENCAFNDEATDDGPENLNIYQNGPRKNDRIRAILRQNEKIELPAKSKVCDIKFDFPTQDMEYDDDLFFLMDEHVLFSTSNFSKEATDYHPNFNHSYSETGLIVDEFGLQKFKWLGMNGIYNLPWRSDVTPQYCYGIDPHDFAYADKCKIPLTETKGEIKLQIPQQAIIRAVLNGRADLASLERSSIGLSMITTGDNDNKDCEHSEFKLNVKLKYIQDQE
jgi:hypothetical protein